MKQYKILENKNIISDTEVSKAIETAETLIINNLKDFTNYFHYSHSIDNVYHKSDNLEWTTGFWTGSIWLAWEYSHDERLKEAALIQVESFYNRILKRVNIDNHDMGFLYSPSCVSAYKLTGSKKAYEAAILAARNLASRYQEKGKFIQAWGTLGIQENYRLIIDCLLNVPLLFFAYEQTGEPHFKEIAINHINTAFGCVIRPDWSTFHTYYFDKETGAPLKGSTHQGYSDTSAWSRGQAWGIYGAALAYKYTNNPDYINIFRNLVDFYLTKLTSDLIPYWDLCFSEDSNEPKDSSAGACIVCGILEMVKYLKDEEKTYYLRIAKTLLKSLVSNCAVNDFRQSNGLLLHGTYAKKSEFNTCKNRGIDECNTWGDYFYLEALTRLNKEWDSYW